MLGVRTLCLQTWATATTLAGRLQHWLMQAGTEIAVTAAIQVAP